MNKELELLEKIQVALNESANMDIDVTNPIQWQQRYWKLHTKVRDCVTKLITYEPVPPICDALEAKTKSKNFEQLQAKIQEFEEIREKEFGPLEECFNKGDMSGAFQKMHEISEKASK